MLPIITIQNFTFSSKGLTINYLCGNNQPNVTTNPTETAKLFQALGLIEGFELYQGEPVVLFTELKTFLDQAGHPQVHSTTGWQFWKDFILCYKLSKEQAEVIAVYHEEQKRKDQVINLACLSFEEPKARA